MYGRWRLMRLGTWRKLRARAIWNYLLTRSSWFSYCNNVVDWKDYSAPVNFRGGILSDQMGLGKTLSMLALIANDKSQRGTAPETQRYSTLIVVPPQRA